MIEPHDCGTSVGEANAQHPGNPDKAACTHLLWRLEWIPAQHGNGVQREGYNLSLSHTLLILAVVYCSSSHKPPSTSVVPRITTMYSTLPWGRRVERTNPHPRVPMEALPLRTLCMHAPTKRPAW